MQDGCNDGVDRMNQTRSRGLNPYHPYIFRALGTVFLSGPVIKCVLFSSDNVNHLIIGEN